MDNGQLARALIKVNDKFEADMKVAVVKFCQSMNLAFHMVSFYFAGCSKEVRTRQLLKEKTICLIQMDKEQIAASTKFVTARRLLIKEAQPKKPEQKSVWFSGEYDERTYF